jgi:hypothetical protein
VVRWDILQENAGRKMVAILLM